MGDLRPSAPMTPCFSEQLRCTYVTRFGVQCERSARWRVAGAPHCTHHANDEAGRLADEARARREAETAYNLSGRRRPPSARAVRRRKPDQVYFIQVAPDGPIKIGRAVDPANRIRELQTACPYDLVVLAVTNRWTESELHARFAHLRTRGEWFEPHPDLLHLIQRSVAQPSQPAGGSEREVS